MTKWIISILEVNPGTLKTEAVCVARVRDTEANAWNLGVQMWETWLVQNPGQLTRLSMTTAPNPVC